MEQYWEFYNWRNFAIFQLHQSLTIEAMENRMARILENTWIYSPDEIELHIDMWPFEWTVSYGVIRTKRGRIFELHILNHPAAINSALVWANGRNIGSINFGNNNIH